LLPTKTAKSRLQELTQKQYQDVPEYRMEEVQVSESGNIEMFRATVVIAGTVHASAEAPSKKKAHEEAARKTLEQLVVND
jgi:dsRNA-specific ribonuclease